MDKIALDLPGIGNISNPPSMIFSGPEKTTLGYVVSQFLNIAFIIAGFLLFIWFTWGVFEYIFAGGDKNGLASGRKRITWAIIGFLLTIFSFAVSQYASTIFPINNRNRIQNITVPPTITPNTKEACERAGGSWNGNIPWDKGRCQIN